MDVYGQQLQQLLLRYGYKLGTRQAGWWDAFIWGSDKDHREKVEARGETEAEAIESALRKLLGSQLGYELFMAELARCGNESKGNSDDKALTVSSHEMPPFDEVRDRVCKRLVGPGSARKVLFLGSEGDHSYCEALTQALPEEVEVRFVSALDEAAVAKVAKRLTHYDVVLGVETLPKPFPVMVAVKLPFDLTGCFDTVAIGWGLV